MCLYFSLAILIWNGDSVHVNAKLDKYVEIEEKSLKPGPLDVEIVRKFNYKFRWKYVYILPFIRLVFNDFCHLSGERGGLICVRLSHTVIGRWKDISLKVWWINYIYMREFVSVLKIIYITFVIILFIFSTQNIRLPFFN